VRDWRLRPRFADLDFIHLGTAAVLDAVGLRSLAQRIEDSGAVQAIEKLNLDGLLALWHPSVPD
jgi:protease-4